MSGKSLWLALACSALMTLPGAAQEGSGKDEIPSQLPPETENAEPKEAPPAAEPAHKSSKNLEDPPLHRWGGFTIGLAAWSPSTVGAESEVALVMSGSNTPYPLTLNQEASIRETWLVAYHLPKDLGSIVFHYDSMKYSDAGSFLSPGQFIYFESQAYPVYAGGFDNGLADGLTANSLFKTRDTRVEFQGKAWDTKRTHATWGAGVHSVDNDQLLNVTYYALVPNLPPVIPPIVDQTPDPRTFLPLPDTVTQQSDFSGTGPGASLDVEFVIFPRLSVISGLSIGLLRGRTTTYFSSQNSYYYQTFTDENSPEPHYMDQQELFDTLNNGPVDAIRGITQVPVVKSLSVPNLSQAAQTFDLYVGLESRIWRGLKVYATFREMYYQNAGAKTVLTPDGSIDSKPINIGFEGYQIGLSWLF